MYYRLNQKNKDGDAVEYSTDFKFFIKNQIGVSRMGRTCSYYSRLENKLFRQTTFTYKEFSDINNPCESSDYEINRICGEIHKEILEGKHGVGILVD